MPAPTLGLLLQLIGDVRIRGPQLDEIVARAMNADYWRALVPDCHIESETTSLEFAPVDRAAIDAAIEMQRQHGYCRLPGQIAPEGVRRLNAAIDAVVAAGWPPAFVFVFDEAWQSGRSVGARDVLESSLGPGVRHILHNWAHVVKPVVGMMGWSPHTDGMGARLHGRMSVWVGLTDATLENGCMHVVPNSAISSAPDVVTRFQKPQSQFVRPEVSMLLHASRALVTAPGDALVWRFDTIHWGGYVHRAGQERRALSFEFIAAGEPALDTDGPVASIDESLPFGDRLRAVAEGLLSYRKYDPLLERFADVADDLIRRLEPRAG